MRITLPAIFCSSVLLCASIPKHWVLGGQRRFRADLERFRANASGPTKKISDPIREGEQGTSTSCSSVCVACIGDPPNASLDSSLTRPPTADRSRRYFVPAPRDACVVFRAARSEDGSKREVIQITSHSPSTRCRILTNCVAARPTLFHPSPHL